MRLNTNLKERPQYVFLIMSLSFIMATITNYFILGDRFRLLDRTPTQDLGEVVAQVIGLSLPGTLFYALIYSTMANYKKPTNSKWNMIHFYLFVVMILISILFGVFGTQMAANEGAISPIGVAIFIFSFCPFLSFLYNIIRSGVDADFGNS